MRRLAWLLFTLGACSPAGPAELAPVFVVLCPDVDPEQPPTPCCTAFALGSQVVTANHCAPKDAVPLVSRKQWTETSGAYSVGHVTLREEGRDIAWLDAPLDAPGLAMGRPVAEGDTVRALTRSGAKEGLVGQLAGAFWQSTADTHFGDSGAAIVDASGAAVGVLSRCLTTSGKDCDPNTGIFAELP